MRAFIWQGIIVGFIGTVLGVIAGIVLSTEYHGHCQLVTTRIAHTVDLIEGVFIGFFAFTVGVV